MKGEGLVELWHSLLDSSKDHLKWYSDLKSQGIQPEGGVHQRETCVYFHKPDECIYSEEALEKPSVKVEIPADQVYAVELTKCSAEEGSFSIEEWENSLTPYKDFEPEETAEYVVFGEVDPDLIVDFSENGPYTDEKPEKQEEGWEGLDIDDAEIGCIKGLQSP